MTKFKQSTGFFGGRVAATIGVLSVAFLVACGGGGGGSTTASAVSPPAATFTFACWNGPSLSVTAPPGKDICVAVPSADIKVTVVATTLSFSGIPSGATLSSSTVTAQSGASVVTFTNGAVSSGTVLFNTAYTFTSGKLNFSNAPDLTIAGSFTTGVDPAPCVLPAMKNSLNACISPPATTGYTWNTGLGAWVANVGVKVIGTNELPTGCTFWADQCWKDSVANGTVKFIATPALMVGYSDRPVVFAYYRLYSTIFKANQWNYLAIYADDGSLVGSNIFGGLSQEVDFAQGSAKGVFIHEKSTGDCYEIAWDPTPKSWKVNGGAPTTPVTCPN